MAENCAPLAAAPTALYEYHFDGDGWDGTDGSGVTFEDQVRAALADWESVNGLTGAPLIDIEETEDDGVGIVIADIFDYSEEPPVPAWRLAQHDCASDLVIVNALRLDGQSGGDNPPDEFLDLPGVMGPVVRHEFGHMMGLNHSGFSDSLLDAKHPAMGSCFGRIPPAGNWDLRDADVSHDDAAALHQRFSPPGWTTPLNTASWLAVNPGFEAAVPASGWNGLFVSYGIGTTGAHQGQHFLEVTPSGSSEEHKLYQWTSMAFAEQDGDPWQQVHLSGFAFARSLGGSEEVVVRVLAKPVAYSTEEASCHDNPTKTFQNVRATVSPAMQVTSGTFTVGSSWTSVATSPGWVDNSGGEGAYDVALVVQPQHGGAGIALDDAGTRVGTQWAY